MKRYLFSLLISMIALTACEKDNLSSANSVVLKVSPKQALISVELDAEDLPKGSKEIGIAYAKTDEFSKKDYAYTEPINAGLYSNQFKVKLVHLECGTSYTYCVYVKTDKETKMGTQFNFNTEPLPQYAVDLGLSNDLLWADRNLGANDPKEGGDYYAWGETEPKTYFSNSNYKFYIYDSESERRGFSKYTIPDGAKFVLWYDAKGNFIGDYKHTLEPEDDAVTKKWGGAWRMPSRNDYDVLTNECKISESIYPDIEGTYAKSTNGLSIFFPFVLPAIEEGIEYRIDDQTFYWTNTLLFGSDYSRSNSTNAIIERFLYKQPETHMILYLGRSYAALIRGVYDCNI